MEDILGEKELTELKKFKQNLGDELGRGKYDGINRDSKAGSLSDTVRLENEYEAQYDPNNDFAIFGVGDPTRGGIQTMQEKMNLADGVKDAGDSSDESDDDDDESMHRKDSKLSTQVQTNIHPSSRGSKGISDD